MVHNSWEKKNMHDSETRVIYLQMKKITFDIDLAAISYYQQKEKINSRISLYLFSLLPNAGAESTRVTGKCLIIVEFGQL